MEFISSFRVIFGRIFNSDTVKYMKKKYLVIRRQAVTQLNNVALIRLAKLKQDWCFGFLTSLRNRSKSTAYWKVKKRLFRVLRWFALPIVSKYSGKTVFWMVLIHVKLWVCITNHTILKLTYVIFVYFALFCIKVKN